MIICEPLGYKEFYIVTSDGYHDSPGFGGNSGKSESGWLDASWFSVDMLFATKQNKPRSVVS